MREAFRQRLGSEGIYFVVRLPAGWFIICERAQERDDPAHIDFWETQLSRCLARKWAPTFGISDSALLSRISNCPYAFPRGRIVKCGGKYVVYHGDDLEPFMKVSRRMIEQSFGIVGKAHWELDEHERCQREDKELVQQVLGIRENWKNAD